MVSIRTVNISHLNVPLVGIIDFKNCQPSIFTDRRYWRRLSCDLKGFLEMTPERKMFFELSIFDIQRENKGYSICQILHNNDLSIYTAYLNCSFWFHTESHPRHLKQLRWRFFCQRLMTPSHSLTVVKNNPRDRL